MDSVVFYQPPLATVPNFKDKLVRPLATLPRNDEWLVVSQNSEWSWRGQQACRDNTVLDQENLAVARSYGDDNSDDDDFPPLSELVPKQRGDLLAAKISLRSMTDGKPASSFEPRVGGNQDEQIVLNDDKEEDDEPKSTQSEGTYSKAGDGYDDFGTTGEPYAAPRDPTCELVGNGLDLAPQLLPSNLTATTNSNDGAADEESFLPVFGSIGEPDAPRDPTTELMANGFDLASQLLLFNRTDGVVNNECPPLTKQQRSTSSCCDPALDVIATDDDEDAQPPKRRRLPAFSRRYPSPASTVSKLQEDGTDQTQSLIAAEAAIQQSDLNGHYCRREGTAKSNDDNSLSSTISNEPGDTAGSATTAHQPINQSTNVGDPQADHLWEIRNLIGKRTIDGVVQYWVDWDPTWMCESELEGARELIKEFEAQLQKRRGNKNGQREADTIDKAQPKRRRGQPSKRL